MHFRRKSKPLQNDRGPRLRRVSIVKLDDLFQFGEAVGIEALLRIGEHSLLLDNRLPQLGVAHHGHAQDLLLLEREVILPVLESLRTDPGKLNVWMDSVAGSSEETDALIGKTVSHFEILELIGYGGMGVVYRAHDRSLDRDVALKFLPPSFSGDAATKERFIQEAKSTSALDHPNIATILEIGETEGRQMFIAMGYYPGDTLKEKIEKGPIAPELAIDYAVQLASALDEAHRHSR